MHPSAAAHAEYARLYTESNQLLQDFPLGLWSAPDDAVFEAVLAGAALGQTDLEPNVLLAKCLRHKRAAAITERIGHLQDDVRAIEQRAAAAAPQNAKPPAQQQGELARPAAGAAPGRPRQGQGLLPDQCGGAVMAPGSSAQLPRRAPSGGAGGSANGGGAGGAAAAVAADKKRERGTPWTEEEHKAFLVGLQQYGKGDWRSISRACVKTRTPTQVTISVDLIATISVDLLIGRPASRACLTTSRSYP
jgi:SHAQKYF class myb-like DNA-binding protein